MVCSNSKILYNLANAPEYQNRTPICISNLKKECKKGSACNNGRHVSLKEFAIELGNLFQGKNVDTPRGSSQKLGPSTLETPAVVKFSSAPNLPSQTRAKAELVTDLIKAKSTSLQTLPISVNLDTNHLKLYSSSSNLGPGHSSNKKPSVTEERNFDGKILEDKEDEIEKLKETIRHLEQKSMQLLDQNAQLQTKNMLLNQENLEFKKGILEIQLIESERNRWRAYYEEENKQEYIKNNNGSNEKSMYDICFDVLKTGYL